MFHLRHSCIFIITLVSLIIVVILLRIDVVPPVPQLAHEAVPVNEIETTEALLVKNKISKKRKLFKKFYQSNNTEFVDVQSSPEIVNHFREAKLRSINTKLLDDNELREGEISDTGQVAPDIVIKYDNGMFGLLDSDPTLHVWQASFVSVGEIWPRPQSVVSSKHVFTLCSRSGSLSFKLSGVDNYILQHAIKRYKTLLCDKKVSVYPSNWRQQEHLLDNALFGQHIFVNMPQDYDHNFESLNSFSASLKGELRSVYVFVESSGHQWPSLYMNESYRLTVNTRGISIVAKETWGALRALESVAQLAWRTHSGRVFINETKIIDQPRFRHRGVMLDTARHFLTKEVLLRNLDAMEMNKMNVFHWHVTDDQSFPLVTEHHPEFAKHGAYDPVTKVYRPNDVKEILEYARLRGIRVIPEIDSPSHSLSWHNSHPEVMTRCIDINGRWSGHYGPLNMAGEPTYRLLKSLFTDIVDMFPDQWIHLGSDEVATSCVLNNQAIQRWMQAKAMFSVDSLTDFYMRKLQNIITEIGRDNAREQRGFIVWQEAYERNGALKNGTIVQLWKSQSTSEAVVLARQRIPVIYSSCWYLDRLEYGAQWVNHYQCDPAEDFGSMMMVNDDGNARSNDDYWKEYVLGGEAAMWTEFFDSDNILARICRSIPSGVASGAGDCRQSAEDIAAAAARSEEPHHYQPFIRVSSDTSSITLITQLLTNLADRALICVLALLLLIAVCIYLQRYSRQCNVRRAMLVLLSLVTVYTLFSIAS